MTFFARNILLVAVVLSGIGAAHGQSAPALAPAALPAIAPEVPGPLLAPGSTTGMSYKNYLYQRYATDKEAKAVIHAYARRQTGGLLWLLTGAATIGFITTQTGPTVSSSGTLTTTVTPLGYGILVGLFGGVGIGNLARFNNTNLYKVLADYDKTRTFDGAVLARVKSSDYR